MTMSAPSPAGQPSTGAAPQPPPTIDQILDSGHIIRDTHDEGQRTQAKELLDTLLGEVGKHVDATKAKQAIAAALQQAIADLDEQIGGMVDQILHDDGFQALESRWRGLNYLVMNTETSTRLKIRVLNVTKKELIDDLTKAPDFDRSLLFKKVYEEEYGTFGGAPFSMMMGDYSFTAAAPDVDLLDRISAVAAAAHAPFIGGADPDLFDIESWTKLGQPGDLAKIFESSRLIKYREFRDKEDSRYATLAMPRVLLRLPYSSRDNPIGKFVYEEDVFDAVTTQLQPSLTPGQKDPVRLPDGRKVRDRIGQAHDRFLFGNAAYALTQRITNAFALYSWTAAIRGVEGGGLVENLPVHLFKTSDGDAEVKCPTEVAITDRRENELSELGFLALCYRKNSGQAAFFGASTANKPKSYFDPKAQSNARLSAALPYILASSRFAHYLKVIVRDKIGSFETRATVEQYLNNWIGNYVLLSDSAGQETKARYPLREARIDVTEVAGKPGAYRAVAFLKPHFQLNELTISLRLVAELPPPAA
jgi:type VI secretion system protein ImpC